MYCSSKYSTYQYRIHIKKILNCMNTNVYVHCKLKLYLLNDVVQFIVICRLLHNIYFEFVIIWYHIIFIYILYFFLKNVVWSSKGMQKMVFWESGRVCANTIRPKNIIQTFISRNIWNTRNFFTKILYLLPQIMSSYRSTFSGRHIHSVYSVILFIFKAGQVNDFFITQLN